MIKKLECGVVSLILLSLVLQVAPASAAEGLSLISQFGGGVDATHPGNVCIVASGDACQSGTAGAGEGEFSGPNGVAVDQTTGDLYVVDAGNDRVEKFDERGNFLGHFNGSDAPGGPFLEPTAVAVEPATGDVYVADTGHNVVDKFTSSGAYVPESQLTGPTSGEPFEDPDGLAVDPSSNNPTSGDLFVANHESGGAKGRVFAFAPTGELVRQFTPEHKPWSLAVDANSNVYVAEKGTSEVNEYTAEGALVRLVESGIAESVAVDPGNGEVYVNDGAHITEHEPDEATTIFTAGELTAGVALAVATATGEVYVSQTAGNDILVFGTPPAAKPVISDESSANTSQTGSTLEAQVASNELETSCDAQYVTTAAFNSTSYATATSAPCSPALLLKSNASAHVLAAIDGLTPNTSYVFRFVAENPLGSERGADEPLLTLPATPTTEAPLDVRDTGATFTGSFDPEAHETHYFFEYGQEPCFPGGCSNRTAEEDAGAPTAKVPVAATLSDLTPLTTYYYRLVVSNASAGLGGSAYGLQQKVVIPLAPLVTTEPPAAIGTNGAEISGEVDPQGASTSYRFEYGQDASYGQSAPASEASAGSALGSHLVRTFIEPLQPDTVYHYRLVATNSVGTTPGADASFRTDAAGAPSAATPSAFSLTGIAPSPPAAPGVADLTSIRPILPHDVDTPKRHALSCDAQARKLKSAKRRKAAIKRCAITSKKHIKNK